MNATADAPRTDRHGRFYFGETARRTTTEMVTEVPEGCEIDKAVWESEERALEEGRKLAERYTKRGYPTKVVMAAEFRVTSEWEGETYVRSEWKAVLRETN